jgi:hypothetical protein
MAGTVERFVEVVCPLATTPGLNAADVVAGLDNYLAALPVHLRVAIRAGFAGFGAGARLYPAARGRRFADLDGVTADRYFRAVAGAPVPGVRNVAKLLKSLVTFSFYELPEARASVGYDPDPFIAEVNARRAGRYAADIERGERAVHE